MPATPAVPFVAPALLAAALFAASVPLPVSGNPGQPGTAPGATTAEPAQDNAALTTVRTQFDAGNLGAAMVALKTALRDNPADPDALLLLADLLLARFDAAGAETTLRRALAAGATPAAAYPALAKALILQGRAADVLEELAPTSAMVGPARARLLTQHAAAQMVAGEQDQAAAMLEQALAASDQVPEPHAARAAMAMADQDLDAAREHLARATALATRDDEPWLVLGRLEQAAGNRAAAEAAYGEAIARAPVHWRSAYARALLRLYARDLDGAAADIALAEAQFPEFVGLVYAHAQLDLLQGRPAKAAEGFERYLGAVPNDANALFFAAWAANQLGNREQALGYLERLQAVEGKSPRLLWLEARTLLADKDPGGAWALLRDAVAGDAPPPRLVLAAEAALVQLDRAGEALDLVVRARGAHSDATELMAAEARLRLAAGELEKAEALTATLAERDPESAEALILRARIAAQRDGADAPMLLALEQARQRAPDDIRLPVLLGSLHGARGEGTKACAALVDALRLNPAEQGVIARLQRLDCARQVPELLQDAYAALLETHPDAVRALPALLAMDAETAADGSALEASIGRLFQAHRADPGNVELRAQLALALMRNGEADEAASILDATPPQQLGEPKLLRAAGLMALMQDDAAAAARAFQDLYAAQPGTAEPAYLLADARAQTGELSGARYHLTEGLRLDPDHPLAAIAAARIFSADDAVPARRQLIDDIKRQAPDSPLIPSLQAQTLFDAGRPDKSAELLTQMHAERPDDPRLFARLLLTLAAADQRAKARSLAEQWAEAHPADAGVALVTGDLYAMDGEMARAAHWYRQVLALAPEQPQALNNLAVILTDSEPAEAVRLAERALKQNPKDPEVMDSLGMALLAAGDSARARALLNQAYALSNQRPLIGLNLARVLAADGDPARAREVLRPVVQQEFPQQAEARALMQELGANRQ